MPVNHPILSQALQIHPGDVIAFVGAGGKTTAMFDCAKSSIPCVVTTTTHLFETQAQNATRHIIALPGDDVSGHLEKLSPQEVLLITGPLNPSNQRLTSPDDQQMMQLKSACRQKNIPLFIEADGARTRSIKAPAKHEPAIPSYTTKVVVVAGMSAIGQPLSEDTTHRPEIFAQLAGMRIGENVTPQYASAVLCHSLGGLKNIPISANKYLLLTQVDSIVAASYAAQIGNLAISSYESVILSNIKDGAVKILSKKSKIAGVILAAGKSQRLGRPKQLELFLGKPFVRRIAETALAAGLFPVLVVTGKHHKQIVDLLADLPVVCVKNPEWEQGQGTSVAVGTHNLPTEIGAAIYMVCDQPQLEQELIESLIEEHQKRLSPVIVPMIAGKRSNPVLFGNQAFSELAKLKGEAGGRQVFHQFQVEYLEWLDDLMALDVDTEEDLVLLERLSRERGGMQ